MKLLYVNPAAGLGGAELSLLDLMASTRATMPHAELHLVLMAPGPMAERAGSLGIRVHIMGMPNSIAGLGDSALRGRGGIAAALGLCRGAMAAVPEARRYARDLSGLIRGVGPDLIHSNGIKSHMLLRLSRAPGVPVVWHIRDFLGSRPVAARALRWAATGGVAGGIAISEAVGRDARAVIGPGLPIEVVYNGVETDRFAPGAGDGPRLDRLAGLPPPAAGTLRVGLVATYARWKGQDIFLDALARLGKGPGPPVRGFVVGGPIYETRGSQFTGAELRARAESLGLAGRVGFVPFQSETAEIYRALDVAVNASTLPEPFGRTIVEAMACGCPAVVAGAGGAAELFADGRDALGVKPGDPEALADAIRRLVDNPALRQAIGERGRRVAVSRFDRRRLGPEVLDAYVKIGAINRGGPPSYWVS